METFRPVPQQKAIHNDFIGDSREIEKVFKTIRKVANSDSTVLITGESGTGKELTARAIHNNSYRCHNPLVVINCGAIPSELLESELFGHEKGAFTGAHQTRIGRFEMADGGTIFLDEIGDMSPSLQIKLLRVLQEQCFERVGNVRTINVDIRIISATNKNLKQSMEDGNFREDLYYRLNVIPIDLPPLRERTSDIPLLIEHFIKKQGSARKHHQSHAKSFTEEAILPLLDYQWPGNVRELENLVERLTIMVEDETITSNDLPEKIRTRSAAHHPQPDLLRNSDWPGFTQAVNQFQKDLILEALNQTSWIKTKAAELLKMNRTTLVEKIKKMALEPEKNQNPSNHNAPGRQKDHDPKARIDIAPLIHPNDTPMPQAEKRVNQVGN